MRTSAAGSDGRRPDRARLVPACLGPVRPDRLWSAVANGPASRGVTLLELLVVVALMAVASAGVVLALRDSPQHRLDREAQQLVPWLEAARTQARARGLVVRWIPAPNGHTLEGLPPDALPALTLRWTDPDTRVLGGPLVLGPEPLLPAQAVVLQLAGQPATQVRIGTDGVRPFQLLP